MDFPTRIEVLRRLHRELEMLNSMQDVIQKNCDRNNRLGLKEVSAFESGMLYSYQYCCEVLNRLIDIISGSDKSDD